MLTCLIADEDALLTRHPKCVWLAVTLALRPHNSSEAAILAGPAMAGVKFVQVLLKSPLQVQSFHRGTGHLLDQLIQWRQLQGKDAGQSSELRERASYHVHRPHWSKSKSHSCFHYSCPYSVCVSRPLIQSPKQEQNQILYRLLLPIHMDL